MFVVNFAVTHPSFEHLSLADLKKKYQIDHPYFMAPNQFWVHKNHKVVLAAALFLKDKNLDFKIIFTGKENDFRAPEYTNELKQYVLDNGLSENVSFLGFIPREEQLCLMKNSIAIIQPSLFEGWSTVVEDAKALNKLILLSDIAVHREQINQNVCFFNPKQTETLAQIIIQQLQTKYISSPTDYYSNLVSFGKGFYEMLNHSLI